MPINDAVLVAGISAIGTVAAYYLAKARGWNTTIVPAVASVAFTAIGSYVVGEQILLEAET